MANLTSRSLDINALDTDEIYKIDNAGLVEARTPVSSVRDPSVTLIAGFVAGPLDPIVNGDSVLEGLEKHEGRVLNHEQTSFNTGLFQSVITTNPGGMFAATTGKLIYKGPPKKITAISAKLTVEDTGADPTFQFTVNGGAVSVVTAISTTDTETSFTLSAADQPVADGDVVDVISVQGGGDALGFDGWLSLADQ